MAITAPKAVELVPVMRERLADLETPVSAFAKLRSLGGAFLLESAEGGERMGRYSFIGVAPRTRLYFRDGTMVAERDPQDVDFHVPAKNGVVAMTHVPAADPMDALRAEVGRYRRESRPDLPRFSGGAVGFVTYEAARRFERLPLATNDPYSPWGLPDMVFGIYDTVIAFDHLRHTLTVLAHDDAASPGGAGRMIDRVFAALDAPLPAFARSAAGEVRVTPSGSPDEYTARVSRARELIADGDCIQI
ncbi:MAG TPA: hypothetical protein VJP45_01000, partial [Candidatus Limnocylindria bacterium]|nr:hypothetical protein [Candidatus Limnocylindria bacterium]